MLSIEIVFQSKRHYSAQVSDPNEEVKIAREVSQLKYFESGQLLLGCREDLITINRPDIEAIYFRTEGMFQAHIPGPGPDQITLITKKQFEEDFLNRQEEAINDLVDAPIGSTITPYFEIIMKSGTHYYLRFDLVKQERLPLVILGNRMAQRTILLADLPEGGRLALNLMQQEVRVSHPGPKQLQESAWQIDKRSCFNLDTTVDGGNG